MDQKIFIDGKLVGISQEEKWVEVENEDSIIKMCYIAGLQVSEHLIIEQFHSTEAKTEDEFIEEMKVYCKDNDLSFKIVEEKPMESWNINQSEFVEMPKKVKQFLEDIKQVCKNHNLSISHEDGHGGFIIEQYDEDNIDWLSNASLNIDEEKVK